MKKYMPIVLALAFVLGGCSMGEDNREKAANPTATEIVTPAPVQAITEEELAEYEELFIVIFQQEGNGEMQTNPLNCMLTSYYDSVKDIDMAAFLRYFPGAESGSQAEFEALRSVKNWPFADLERMEDMPVPLRRYDGELVRQALSTYAGLGLEDVDISPERWVYYLEEYDAFYNFTSDFGLEQPEFYRGERQGDIVRLYWQHRYDGERELTLIKTEDGVRVLSNRILAETE